MLTNVLFLRLTNNLSVFDKPSVVCGVEIYFSKSVTVAFIHILPELTIVRITLIIMEGQIQSMMLWLTISQREYEGKKSQHLMLLKTVKGI